MAPYGVAKIRKISFPAALKTPFIERKVAILAVNYQSIYYALTWPNGKLSIQNFHLEQIVGARADF